MQNQLKAGTACLFAAGLVALLFVSGCGRSDPDANPVETASKAYPPQLANRVQLRRPGAGEAIRFVQYDPIAGDGKGELQFADQSRSHAVVQYRDTHKTAYIDYRTDGPNKGTIKAVKVLFPAPEKSDARAVARLLELDVDGHTIIADTQYRPDGKTVAHTGNRTAADTFESYDFQPDSANVARHKRFTLADKKWKLALDETYRPDKSLLSVATLLADGSRATDTYSEKQVLVSHAVMDSSESNETTEYYLADGKTVSSKVTRTSYNITVDTFKNGELVNRRSWGYGYNSMTVTVYENGKPAYRQNWSLKSGSDTDKLDENSYELKTIDHLNAAEKVTQTVTLASDGKTASSIRVADPKNPDSYWAHTQKTFRDDGTLEKVEVYDKDGKITSTDTHTVKDNVREPVPEKMLNPQHFEQPPKMLPSRFNPFQFGEFED